MHRCKTLNHIFICFRLVIQADHPCKLPTKKTSLWEHSRVAPYQGTRYHLNMDMEVTRIANMVYQYPSQIQYWSTNNIADINTSDCISVNIGQ